MFALRSQRHFKTKAAYRSLK